MSKYQVTWVNHTQNLHQDIIEAESSDAAIAAWNALAADDAERWVVTRVELVE